MYLYTDINSHLDCQSESHRWKIFSCLWASKLVGDYRKHQYYKLDKCVCECFHLCLYIHSRWDQLEDLIDQSNNIANDGNYILSYIYC